MTSPVDNFANGITEPLGDLTPQLEALARLYELIERYGASDCDMAVASAAARHRAATGHSLSFGCCSGRRIEEIDV